MATSYDSIPPSHTDEGTSDDISVPTDPSKQKQPVTHVSGDSTPKLIPGSNSSQNEPENQRTENSFAQSLILSALAGAHNQVENLGIENGHLSFRVSSEGEVQLVALQECTTSEPKDSNGDDNLTTLSGSDAVATVTSSSPRESTSDLQHVESADGSISDIGELQQAAGLVSVKHEHSDHSYPTYGNAIVANPERDVLSLIGAQNETGFELDLNPGCSAINQETVGSTRTMKTAVCPPPRLFVANTANEAHEIIQNFAEETMTTFVSMRKMKQFGQTGNVIDNSST